MKAEHARYRDDVAAYALGALTDPEAAGLRRHLSSCEACSSDLERFRAVVETLAATVKPRSPGTQLKQEVLQRIRESEGVKRSRPSRRERSGRWAARRPGLAAAGMLASVALAAGGYVLGSSASGDGRDELQATVDRARAPGVSASLERRGDIGVLRTSKLAPLDNGVYVLWVDRGAGPVNATSFNPGSGGTAEVGLSSLARVKHLMVTREATPRVALPTTGPILTLRVQ